MSRLDEIIEQVAKELKFNELPDGGFSLRTELVINVSKLYAAECVKASLNKAYQESLINSDLHTFCTCEIDEESITQESNIVLL